jgi:hypothetical protein
MQFRRLTAFFVLLVAPFARAPLAGACAVCLTGADGGAGDAYKWSVVFLMAAPYIVMGSVAGYLFYAYRRAAAAAQQEPRAAETAIPLSLDQKESGR